jgi:hypothetical protein
MLTALWQATNFRERDWISELFGSHIQQHVFDGNHSIVMDNCILFDKFIHRRPAHYYEQFRERQNVFLFHLSDEQYHGGYEVYGNFNGVFRNYWSSVFDSSIKTLPLGYSNGVSRGSSGKPASSRKYTWSFAGETRRASRPEMVSALRRTGVNLCHSTDERGAKPLPVNAYRSVMEDTTFAPSPMGRINLECFRLYEALECGCIPIVEKRSSLDYFTSLLGPNPLISVKSWSEVPEIINRLSASADQLDVMQSDVYSWWQSKKETLKGEVSHVLASNQSLRVSSMPRTRAQYRLPLWQPLELRRHQSTMSLFRRARIQLERFVMRGGRRATTQ